MTRKRSRTITPDAPVAQWIEQPPPKGQVARSIRVRGAKFPLVKLGAPTEFVTHATVTDRMMGRSSPGSGALLAPAHLFVALAILVLFRAWLSVVVPMTGDEAYYAWWARNSYWGGYDHPPMIGWILAPLVQINWREWWLRLPATLAPFFVAGACWVFVMRSAAFETESDVRPELALAAALLAALQPVGMLDVIITTDTPLLYFGVLSALVYARATETNRPRDALWAGVWLAGASLSKYFAVLLGLAYFLHVLTVERNRRGFVRLALVVLPVIPAVGFQVWWNSANCWSNVIFNFSTRQEGNAFNFRTPLLYFAMLAWTLSPYLVWALWKERRELLPRLSARPGMVALTFALVVPLVVLGGVSLYHTVGLHWVLAFVPLVCVVVTTTLSRERLRLASRFAATLAILQALIVLAISFVPIERYAGVHKYYDRLVIAVRPQAMLGHLTAYSSWEWAAESFSIAATLGYHAQRYMHTWGPGSVHGRNDDLLTDWRRFEGGNIAIFLRSEPRIEHFAPYFATFRVQPFAEYGAPFWLVLGEGFRYEPYRRDVLVPILEKHYPPVLFGSCPVRERYTR
jgi:hypothetical protein